MQLLYCASDAKKVKLDYVFGLIAILAINNFKYIVATKIKTDNSIKYPYYVYGTNEVEETLSFFDENDIYRLTKKQLSKIENIDELITEIKEKIFKLTEVIENR